MCQRQCRSCVTRLADFARSSHSIPVCEGKSGSEAVLDEQMVSSPGGKAVVVLHANYTWFANRRSLCLQSPRQQTNECKQQEQNGCVRAMHMLQRMTSGGLVRYLWNKLTAVRVLGDHCKRIRKRLGHRAPSRHFDDKANSRYLSVAHVHT